MKAYVCLGEEVKVDIYDDIVLSPVFRALLVDEEGRVVGEGIAYVFISDCNEADPTPSWAVAIIKDDSIEYLDPDEVEVGVVNGICDDVERLIKPLEEGW